MSSVGMGEAKRVLVTGGAGFVGATLVRRLIAGGHTVRSLDNYSTGDPSHLHGVEVELVEGDIRSIEDLDAAVRGQDAVVHLAAAGSVVGSVQDPRGNFEVNVLGTFNVLDAARRAGVGRVVQASTGGALIGSAEPPVDERSLPKPISPYGASKLAGEGYAHAFAKAFGLGTVALRFANVYGPWSELKKGAMTTFFNALRSGDPLLIFGDGSSTRDYTHVDDISRALHLALDSQAEGGTVLHISSGIETSVQHLAEVCRSVAGLPDHPIEYRGKRPGEVERNCANFDLATQVLGYRPTIGFEEGVRQTWEWYEKNVFSAT